ncbi:hypothetical protein [Microvirga lotononidis]|nr:hypothetical protein [Microvirga lotononidis]WQO30474.1 hypothetical protein U0023_23765 [Microvirga lotononidis]
MDQRVSDVDGFYFSGSLTKGGTTLQSIMIETLELDAVEIATIS